MVVLSLYMCTLYQVSGAGCLSNNMWKKLGWVCNQNSLKYSSREIHLTTAKIFVELVNRVTLVLTVILSSYPEWMLPKGWMKKQQVVELIFSRHCIVRDSVVKFWGKNNEEIKPPPYLLLFPCLSVAKWFGINLSCQSLGCIEDWSQNASALDLFQNFPPPCLSNEAGDRIAGANLISSSSNNPTAKTKSYKLCSVLKGMTVSGALYIALLFFTTYTNTKCKKIQIQK